MARTRNRFRPADSGYGEDMGSDSPPPPPPHPPRAACQQRALANVAIIKCNDEKAGLHEEREQLCAPLEHTLRPKPMYENKGLARLLSIRLVRELDAAAADSNALLSAHLFCGSAI